MRDEQEGKWSEMDGTVTTIRGPSQSPNLDLTSGTGRAYLKVMEADPESLELCFCKMRSKPPGFIKAPAPLTATWRLRMLVPDIDKISVVEMALSQWAAHPVRPINSQGSSLADLPDKTVHIRGTVVSKFGQYPS